MARYYRKVIQIKGEHSPNVRYALAEQAAGLTPSNREVVPGVLSWAEYRKRLATWDPIRLCIGIHAEFYEGKEVLLYPPEWLNLAERRALMRPAPSPGSPKWLGVDPAEGGDKSCWSVIDRLGLLRLVSQLTPDTTVVTATTLALMREYGIPAENVAFDRGGGGKEHADRLRLQGYPVRTVAFGESLILEPKRGMTRLEEKVEQREDRYAYVNRRAEMYGALSLLLDPSGEAGGFALPGEYHELRRQLAVIPKLFDPEGRLRMLPKNKRGKDTKEKTLTELIGHSPDESDSCVLAIHAMTHKQRVVTAGGM